MSETFAELFEKSLSRTDMQPGSIIKGTVTAVSPDFVTVYAGLKSEGHIPIEQFLDEQGNVEVAVGDEVDVALEAVENGWGETRLSREKAKRASAWIRLAAAYQANETVKGIISSRVKGGFTVRIQEIHAFLPGSLLDLRPIKDLGSLEGKELDFKVIKLDQKRNNVVVSRRSVMEAESADREVLMTSLQEGQEIKGVVKNLTDYGAFVDLGGLDGLLHITDMAWRRVKHPNEVVNVGQEVTVKILKFDRERNRVSLGLKQLGDDPWLDITQRYPVSTKLVGKVTNITDYGCFVEIEDGVEGLVHVSEMDWTNKNIHPSRVVQLDDEVEVVVLDIDEERRRISLGLKQCKENPWELFAATHNKGDKVSGKLKSITDFGLFIGLDGGIDGLVHLSDISWHEAGEEAVKQYKKGDEVEAVILAIDPERERVSLGIKQLAEDPYSNYLAQHAKGSVVQGVLGEVDVKGAVVHLAEGIDGYLRATEYSRDRVEDLREHLKQGDTIEAQIINIDRKTRVIALSIKAREAQEENEVIKELSRSENNSGSGTLGDLLKEQMENREVK